MLSVWVVVLLLVLVVSMVVSFCKVRLFFVDEFVGVFVVFIMGMVVC